MKFTILSHAGLLVESRGISIVVDPWLVGSCYWRSWFNFPEPDRQLIDGLAPDYIYLTHLHWDHFHGPSLRRFDPVTPVLIPKIPSLRMIDDLAYLGFKDVREIPHGGALELASRFSIHSFQFGPVGADSAIVLQDGDTTLLDANDCKIFGVSLKQITRQFPAIDFVLRSHSNADAFPYCVEGYDPRKDLVRGKEEYLEEFAAFARSVGARYAVPFASNHCFVHKETRRFNGLAVLPNEIAEYMSSQDDGAAGKPRCVVMPSGSSWGVDEGFRLKDFDYTRQGDYVEILTRRYSHWLDGQYRRETEERGHFLLFKRYAHEFLRALGWPLRRLLPVAVFVVIEGAGKRYWVIDSRKGGGRVAEASDDSAGELVVTVPALVINDCVRQRMFPVLSPSKRLRIRLAGAPMWRVRLYFLLLTLYDNGELPLWRVFRVRTLSIWLRRWREPLSIAAALIGWKLTRRIRRVSELYRA